MANIKTHLDKIKNALFGQEVRGSIHDGIDAINKEVESTTERQNKLGEQFKNLVINEGSSNAEIVVSRGTHDWLPNRLDNIDLQFERIEELGVKKGELVVNVKDFGAIGDGVADDTEAIKKALNNGSIITFPRGIYRITDTIHINKSFVMIGSDWCGDTNLNKATTTIFLDNATPGKYAFICDSSNNKIKGLTFKGKGYDISPDRRNWTNCFKFNKGTVYGDTDVEIESCHFYRFCTHIEFEGRGLHCSNNQFVESWKPIILKHFNNDEKTNPPIHDWQTNERGFRKFHFVNNQIHSCQGWFVSCKSTSDNNYEKHIHQVVLSGNRFDGTGGVWEGFIGGGIVTGNVIGKSDSTVYSDVKTPIFSLLGCKQMTFVGNTIYSELDYGYILGRKTQLDDVWVFGQNLGDFQDIVITGNTIRNVGRRVVKASQTNVYRLIFTNNNINGVLLIEDSSTVSAFEFDAGANHIKIKDNIIINTNGVKHDKLVNFTQRGVQNHDIKDNIFNSSEFAVSNNAYAWNKNSNIIYSSYSGNGTSSQTFTVNQNIDYIIISDSVNNKSFVKRAGSSLGDNICSISDNSYTIKNTSDFNNNGITYSIIIVCC